MPVSAYKSLLQRLQKYFKPEDKKDPKYRELTDVELSLACEHFLLNNHIFDRLKHHCFKIKISKLKLFQTEAATLGVILNSEGIKVDPKRVEKVKAMPMPTNLKQMQSYCGFCRASLFTLPTSSPTTMGF